MKTKVTKCLQIKKEIKKNIHDLPMTSRNKSIKEHLIIALRTDQQYYQNEEIKKNQIYESVASIRTELEINGKELQKYCADIKESLKDFAALVDKYEKRIAKYKMKKEQIILSSEAVIKQKLTEQTELKHQYDIMNGKIEKQINQLTELDKKIKDLEQKKKKEKKIYVDNENLQIAKYNEFVDKYKALLGKYNSYQIEEEKTHHTTIMAQRMGGKKEELTQEDLEMYYYYNIYNLYRELTEMRLRNELLKKDAEILTTRIFTTTQNNTTEEMSNSIGNTLTQNNIMTTQASFAVENNKRKNQANQKPINISIKHYQPILTSPR